MGLKDFKLASIKLDGIVLPMYPDPLNMLKSWHVKLDKSDFTNKLSKTYLGNFQISLNTFSFKFYSDRDKQIPANGYTVDISMAKGGRNTTYSFYEDGLPKMSVSNRYSRLHKGIYRQRYYYTGCSSRFKVFPFDRIDSMIVSDVTNSLESIVFSNAIVFTNEAKKFCKQNDIDPLNMSDEDYILFGMKFRKIV